jgi:5'-3' exonuclease
MGVLGLWRILDAAAGSKEVSVEPKGGSTLVSLAMQTAPVKGTDEAASSHSPSPPSPSSLTHRLLAVDLSVWLMEAFSVSRTFDSVSSDAMFSTPGKYHLTYVFQRACAFLRQSIRLIFVTDGRPPRLKSRLTSKENQIGTAIQGHKGGGGGKHLAQVQDCVDLLKLMGLPVLVLQKGEAEALCGQLNARGCIDGVITPDADCFLFGGKTVLRNLEASQTSLTARIFTSSAIESHLGLQRESLILLALCLGSDYTSGVRNLGPRKAVKLMRVLEECIPQFLLHSAHSSSSSSSPQIEHPLLRFFRCLVAQKTAEKGVDMICKYHSGMLKQAGSSQAASSSSSLAPPSASSVLDYSLLSVSNLTLEMAKRGLKAQSKAAMIQKLHQIQMLSPTSAAMARDASPPPLAMSQPSATMTFSDSEEDEEEEEKPAKKGRKNTPSAAAKSRLSLSSFLSTYFSKLHSRYHSSLDEVDRVLSAYMTPDLQPSVTVMEQRIPQLIPNPPDFVKLRGFCANEMKLSFVKFEKQWLPVLMHLELWRQEVEGRKKEEQETEVQSSQDSDVVELSPPPTAASSSSSSIPSHVTPSSCPPPPLYTLSHLAKRRVIAGVPHFVLVWRKTDKGRREIATLPKGSRTGEDGKVVETTAAAASSFAALHAADSDDGFDLTVSPSISSSPLVSPFLSSPAVAKRSLPLQNLDAELWESYEPVSFMVQAHPDIVRDFEEEEERKKEEKERERKEMAENSRKEKKGKKGVTATDGDENADKPKRGRKKKSPAIDSTPPITSFLSPVPTAARASSPIPRTSSTNMRDVADLTSPPPASSRTNATAQPAAAATSKPSSMGKIGFPSAKPTVQKTEKATAKKIVTAASAHGATSAKPAASTSQQSSLLGFMKTTSAQQKIASVLSEGKAVEDDIVMRSPSPPSPLLCSFSSTLSVCFVCSRAFSATVFASHVNTCLDQQQMKDDEEIAREMGEAQPPAPAAKIAVSSSKTPFSQDEDDDAFLDDEVSEHGELILVPNTPERPVASVLPVAAAATSLQEALSVARSTPAAAASSPQHLTPQKRKKSLEAQREDVVDLSGDGGAPRARRSLHRALDLTSEDEIEEAEVEVIEVDEDEPGSTVYVKKVVKRVQKHARVHDTPPKPPAPPRVVKSIFSRA